MAWFQASVLGALLTLCAGQYPFDDSGGFSPFTNYDQYSQNRARTATTNSFQPSAQSFTAPASSDGNYDVSRSFDYDRQSLSNVVLNNQRFASPEIKSPAHSFDEGRQVVDANRNSVQPPRFTPVTERPRYYEAPAMTYQPRAIQAPSYHLASDQQSLSAQYQTPTSMLLQYRAPSSTQYEPKRTQYRERPTSVQRQPPAEPTPERQFVPHQVEAPVYEPTPRPYQAPVYEPTSRPHQGSVRKTHQQIAPTEAPNTLSALSRKQDKPFQSVAENFSRSRSEGTDKPAVVHRSAPVHYVSIGNKLEGDYKFGYDTGKASNGDESFRRETRDPDGTVRGSYGYVDSTGKQVVVHYEAGKEGYKILSDSEAKQRAEKAQGTIVQSQSEAQEPIQQYAAPVEQEVSQNVRIPQRRVRRLRKRRRERRAVDDDENAKENDGKEDSRSEVSGTGSLRPTGSPRIRLQRTRRPLNPDGRSLRPTSPPTSERILRRRVVVKTTTPFPAASTRPTVPRRQIVPSDPPVTSSRAVSDETVSTPQPRRKRKIRRKFKSTIAPEYQQIQAPVSQTATSPLTSPTVPLAPQTPPAQLAAQILPPTFLQIPFENQTNFFNSYNNIPTRHAHNPHVQHVESPQSLYDQLTSSIYEEAGRVSPSRSFLAQPPLYQTKPQEYQTAYHGSGNSQPIYEIASQTHHIPFPQYPDRNLQLPQPQPQPQPQFQQSGLQPRFSQGQSQDLYSHPSNIDYSRNLLSYNIGTASQ